MRMWSNIDGCRNAGRKGERAHMVEEDECPDHATLRIREHASHFEAAKITAALLDDEVYHDQVFVLSAGTPSGSVAAASPFSRDWKSAPVA